MNVGASKDFGNKISKTGSQDNLLEGMDMQRELTFDEIKNMMDQRIAARVLETHKKQYAPAKINIDMNMTSYYHHFAHPINIMIRDYNDLVKLVFKEFQKQKTLPKVNDVAYALKLARRLGLNLNKNHLSISFLKVREQSNAIKEKLL